MARDDARQSRCLVCNKRLLTSKQFQCKTTLFSKESSRLHSSGGKMSWRAWPCFSRSARVGMRSPFSSSPRNKTVFIGWSKASAPFSDLQVLGHCNRIFESLYSRHESKLLKADHFLLATGLPVGRAVFLGAHRQREVLRCSMASL